MPTYNNASQRIPKFETSISREKTVRLKWVLILSQ